MVDQAILVIERKPAEAKKLCAFFRKNGFRNKIDVVQDKGEAMEYVFHIGKYAGKPNHETPGLIVLDLLTDRTPHVTILKPLHLYLRTADIPIIILTTSEEQEKEIMSHKLSVVGFVRKPLEVGRFLQAVKRMGLKTSLSVNPI